MPRILIVADSTTEAARMVAILREHGYECLEADGAFDAYRVAKAEHPQVILTDLEKSGTDATLRRMLERDPATRDIPVIVVIVWTVRGCTLAG